MEIYSLKAIICSKSTIDTLGQGMYEICSKLTVKTVKQRL